MLFRNFGIAVAFVLLAAVGASAQDEYRTLDKRGQWNLDQSGSKWCTAYTFNDQGRRFFVVGTNQGIFMIGLHDPELGFQKAKVSYRIEIDSARWTLEGNASPEGLSTLSEDPQKAGAIIGELQRGSGVSVFGPSGESLGRFSLNGSGHIVSKFIDCWRGLTG